MVLTGSELWLAVSAAAPVSTFAFLFFADFSIDGADMATGHERNLLMWVVVPERIIRWKGFDSVDFVKVQVSAGSESL